MSRFTRKTFIGSGKDVDVTKDKDIKDLGELMVSENVESTRRKNLEEGLTDPKKFLSDKKKADTAMRRSAVDVIFLEAYKKIYELTADKEESRKKAFKIAMMYQDVLLKEVDKVYPSSTSQRIIIDRPMK